VLLGAVFVAVFAFGLWFCPENSLFSCVVLSSKSGTLVSRQFRYFPPELIRSMPHVLYISGYLCERHYIIMVRSYSSKLNVMDRRIFRLYATFRDGVIHKRSSSLIYKERTDLRSSLSRLKPPCKMVPAGQMFRRHTLRCASMLNATSSLGHANGH
jgi:hypothetical protein